MMRVSFDKLSGGLCGFGFTANFTDYIRQIQEVAAEPVPLLIAIKKWLRRAFYTSKSMLMNRIDVVMGFAWRFIYTRARWSFARCTPNANSLLTNIIWVN